MDERELSRSLEELGLDRESWRALLLLPLVEVAWADGKIQSAERRVIAEIARVHGIGGAEPHLRRWLASRPSRSTFVAGRTLLLRLWSSVNRRPQAQPRTLEELLDLCQVVAEAAGGWFGVGSAVDERERQAMREIAASLGLGGDLPAAVRQAWSAPAGVPPSAVPTLEISLPRPEVLEDTTQVGRPPRSPAEATVIRGRVGPEAGPARPGASGPTAVPPDSDAEPTRPFIDLAGPEASAADWED